MLRDKAALMTLAVFLCGYVALWFTGVTSTGDLLGNLMVGYLLGWGLYAFLSDLPRREIRARFVLMTMVGVLILGTAEFLGVVGMIDYQSLLGTRGRAWFDRPGYVRDPELGYRHASHYRERGTFVRGNIGGGLCLQAHPPEEFDLRYDQHGFRNDEDMDHADVVVIGDSYVESPMLPNSSLLTTILKKLLGTTVANLGMSGYGPEQELIVLKRYGLELQPKTIVWIFFEGNDLEEELENTLQITGTTLDDYWVRSLTRNLLVLSQNVVRKCVPHPTYLQYRGHFQTINGGQRELFFWENPGPLTHKNRERLERLRTIFTEANDLAPQHGFRFVVAFAPTSARVHHGLNNFEPATPQMRNWVVNNLPDEFARMLRSISPSIEFIDLTVPLRDAAAAGTLTYIPDDTHWTAEGQRVAGEAIHQRLRDLQSRIATR